MRVRDLLARVAMSSTTFDNSAKVMVVTRGQNGMVISKKTVHAVRVNSAGDILIEQSDIDQAEVEP